jgi:hypothetical protein
MDAIVLIMETGFALTAFLAVILNLIIAEEIEDEEVPELTANLAEEEKDQAEWDRIRRPSRISQRNRSVANGSGEGLEKRSDVADDTKPDAEKMA